MHGSNECEYCCRRRSTSGWRSCPRPPVTVAAGKWAAMHPMENCAPVHEHVEQHQQLAAALDLQQKRLGLFSMECHGGSRCLSDVRHDAHRAAVHQRQKPRQQRQRRRRSFSKLHRPRPCRRRCCCRESGPGYGRRPLDGAPEPALNLALQGKSAGYHPMPPCAHMHACAHYKITQVCAALTVARLRRGSFTAMWRLKGCGRRRRWPISSTAGTELT